MKTRHKFLIGFIILAVFVLIAWIFLFEFAVYTSDAYIRGNWAAISPRVKGHVQAVHIVNNQHVEKDQLMIELEEYPYQLVLNVRKATLEQNIAQLKLTQVKYDNAIESMKIIANQYNLALDKKKRYKTLWMEQAESKQKYQDVLQELDVIKVKLTEAMENTKYWQAAVGEQSTVIDAARARVALAEYNLSMCKLKAPNPGYVNNMYVRPGDYAVVGEPMFGIVETTEWWVEANYKECYVGKIKPGQKVLIHTDLYPFRLFKGEVVSIGTGIKRSDDKNTALPYIKPTIDWVRLQYRFPVRIKFTDLPPDVKPRMGADVRTLIWVW